MRGLAVALLLFAGTPVYAETVTETVTYAMLDQDTKASAKDACVFKAGRKALAESATLIDSDMEVLRSETSGRVMDRANQAARAYVAGVVRSQVLDEGWDSEGDRLALTCTVKISFDPDDVHKLLEQAAKATPTVASVGILSDIDRKAAMAKQVRHGMTMEEVIAFLGPYTTKDTSEWWRQEWYNWGGVWIGMDKGVVVCVAPIRRCETDGKFK